MLVIMVSCPLQNVSILQNSYSDMKQTVEMDSDFECQNFLLLQAHLPLYEWLHQGNYFLFDFPTKLPEEQSQKKYEWKLM